MIVFVIIGRHARAAGRKRRRPRDHPGADGAAQGRARRPGRGAAVLAAAIGVASGRASSSPTTPPPSASSPCWRGSPEKPRTASGTSTTRGSRPSRTDPPRGHHRPQRPADRGDDAATGGGSTRSRTPGQRARQPARDRAAAGMDAWSASSKASCAAIGELDGRAGDVAGREPGRAASASCSSCRRGRERRGPRKAVKMREAGETVRLLALASPDFRPLLPLLRMGAARRAVDDQEGVRRHQVAHRADHPRRPAAAGDGGDPQGGGAAEPGEGGGGGAARRGHRAGAGARAGAGLQPRRPEVHAPPHRPRLRPPRTRSSWASTARGRTRRGSAGSSRPDRRRRSSPPWPRRGAGIVDPPHRLPDDGRADLRLHATTTARAPPSTAGWYKAIHDFPGDPIHGNIDFTDAIRVSCNVYFGQLGSGLGPEAFSRCATPASRWDGAAPRDTRQGGQPRPRLDRVRPGRVVW